MIRFWSNWFVVLALTSFGTARAAEFLLVDKDATWDAKGSDRMLPTLGPKNWISPENYRDGSIHFRMEVKSKPSAKQIFVQVCVWENSWTIESCSGGTAFTATGSYTYATSAPSAWWKKNGVPINWVDGFDVFGVVVKDKDSMGALMQDTACGAACYPGADLAEHMPIVARFTAVVVSQGGTFSGWENYLGGNQPPVAEAGPNQTLTDTDGNGAEVVALDGSGSIDADGTIQSYVWTEGPTQIGTGQNPTVVLPVGSHTINLTVTDDAGATGSDTVGVLVKPKSQLPWWDPKWSYRIQLTVSTGEFARKEKPAEAQIDFTAVLVSGALDERSLRVLEIDGAGNVLDDQVPFQFDKDPDYEAATHASGVLVWILTGDTAAGTNRSYHVYFDKTGESFSAAPVSPQITVTDDVPHEGQESIKIQTQSATYFYHKQGAGFASLEDAGGFDWIGYNPSTTIPGEQSRFRGIPNMVYPEGAFHPGNTASESAIVNPGPIKTTLHSKTTDNKWECRWEIYPRYAKFTVLKAAHKYWFLYEGTPGGGVDGNSDLIVRADGTSTSLSQNWDGDIKNGAGEEWLYFSDGSQTRSLFFAHHADDATLDSYWLMGGDAGMTVFGFGRLDLNTYLETVPNVFTIGLLESKTLEPTRAAIYAAYKDLAVSVDTVPGNQPPVAEAGANRTVTDGDGNGTETVVLDGSGSIDPDGTIADFLWTEGANQIGVGEKASANLAVGSHTIVLTVTDNQGASGTDTVSVTVISKSGSRLFFDDFEDGDDTDPPWTRWSGDWSVVNGEYRQTRRADNSFSVAGDLGWRDYVVSAKFKMGGAAASGTGPMFRVTDQSHYYLFEVNSGSAETVIWKNEHAQFTKLATGSLASALQANQWYNLKTEILGSSIKCFVDGILAVETSDTSHVAGEIGLNAGDQASFDDVLVESLGGENQGPVAEAGPDQTVTDSDGDGIESVTLDGSGSSDSDGAILLFRWADDAGEIAREQRPTVDLGVGNHTITLTVTDDDGVSDADTVNVVVKSKPGSRLSGGCSCGGEEQGCSVVLVLFGALLLLRLIPRLRCGPDARGRPG